MPLWQRVLHAWGEFLFGNPRRTLIIAGIGFGLYLMNNPAVILGWTAHVMNSVVSPLFNGLLPWFVIFLLCMFAMRKARGGSPSKKGGL